MTIGIILAAGKGTRLNCEKTNKTALKFENKPLICYGADLFAQTTDKTFVVVGAFSESVKQALADYQVEFVEQKKQLGTGHAVKVAVDYIKLLNLKPDTVLVGYADHMMFYPQKVVKDLIKLHQEKQAACSIITTKYHNPNKLAWGRILRDKNGLVKKIVEHKDASPKERKIKELNAGFYCFDWQFLAKNIDKIEKSSVTGEYYLPEMIKITNQYNLPVAAHMIRFRYVGIGINTKKQLKESQKIYQQFH